MKTAFFLITVLCIGIHSEPVLSQNLSSKSQLSKLDPVQLKLVYTADFLGNVSGGHSHGTRYLDNLDVTLNANLDSWVGMSHTKLFLYGLGNHGGSFTELAGDAQTISNIEAENSWRLYEAWIQKTIPSINSSLLFGLYDLNSEFDVINDAMLFINSSHGIGAEYAVSGRNGPSIFPYTSLAIRIKTVFSDQITAKAAVFDGVPGNPQHSRGTRILLNRHDGLLLSGEIVYYPGFSSESEKEQSELLPDRGIPQHDYKVAFGGWKYTQGRQGFDETDIRDAGLYLLAEALIAEFKNNRSVSGFVRFGIANRDINRFSSYTGAGIVIQSPFKNRNNDRAGLAFAIPVSSPMYREFLRADGIEAAPSEMNIELTYRAQITGFFFTQFDVQYIIHPNTRKDISNALAAGLRIQFIL